MPLDLTKPIQTRDGRKATLLRQINHPIYPLAVCITSKGGEENVREYTIDGYFNGDCAECSYDLINVPQKIVVYGWVNVYLDHSAQALHLCCLYSTQKEADDAADKSRIVCIEVRGEGQV